MSDPVQNLLRASHFRTLGQNGPGDHQHRQMQLPRRVQLGPRAATAGILADHHLGSMVAHQGDVTRHLKRPACHDNFTTRQGSNFGRIHQPQQVVMLRLRGKGLQMHPPQRQKNPLRRATQHRNRRLNILNFAPPIPCARLPLGPGKARQLNPDISAGRPCVAAHPGGKRMGRVNHMGDDVVAQILHQPGDPAKSAHAGGQWLHAGLSDPARIGKDRLYAPLGHQTGQIAGLGRATKDQEGWGHV